MERIFFSFIIFIFGLLFGSFINVCIYRIPNGKSIVVPRSHCYNCGTFLQVKDLFPVLSHFFSGGLCRYCGIPVSFRYSFVELITAFLFALFFYNFYFTPLSVLAFIVISYMIVITFIDLDYLIIPDGLSVGAIITGLFANLLLFFFTGTKLKQALGYTLELYDPLLGILLGGGFLFLIAFVFDGGMGGGDIKLMAAIGSMFGLKFTAVVLGLSFLYGAVIGIFLILTRIKGRKDYIPFGPYIAAACLTTLYFGSDFFVSLFFNNWYGVY
ncbi:MAG: prepilin peptidase [Candidatus Muiribacteriota bacterium]